jgi:dolichyl-phosphate beta-glucosyltransferase
MFSGKDKLYEKKKFGKNHAKKVSVLVPAYNEEKRIENSIRSAIAWLNEQDYSYEIIVVDDGSRDSTVNVAKKVSEKVRVISLKQNLGKGAAVRTGMLNASGDFRFFSDADFSTPINELNKLLYRLENGADICIGSRAIDPTMIKTHQPIYRELMGKTFNKIVQLLLIKGIKDTQCGFKGFTKKASDIIFPLTKINGFSFDVEILYLAKKNKLKIEQEPVLWFNDQRSKVNPIVDSINMIVELFKIKKIHNLKMSIC